jgi:hypothetical protein
MLPQNVKIIENSWRARLAASFMHSNNVAIVFGRDIHIWGVTKAQFLAEPNWVKHELKHIEQYEQHGYIGFITKYVWESIKHGYTNNKFEKEARDAEDWG